MAPIAIERHCVEGRHDGALRLRRRLSGCSGHLGKIVQEGVDQAVLCHARLCVGWNGAAWGRRKNHYLRCGWQASRLLITLACYFSRFSSSSNTAS